MALAWSTSRQGAIQQFQQAAPTSGSAPSSGGNIAIPGAPGAIAPPGSSSSPTTGLQGLTRPPVPISVTPPNPFVHLASVLNPGHSLGSPNWFQGVTGVRPGPGFPQGVQPSAGSFGGGGSVGAPAPSGAPTPYASIFHQLVS